MQVSVETIDELGRKLTIALPSEPFEQRIEERLRETTPKVKLNGFRPGKVPLKEVRRRFGKAIREEVAHDMMQSGVNDAVRQEELSLVGSPTVEVVNMEAGDDLKFIATFQVLPEVEVGDLSELSVREPQAEVTDEDVDRTLEDMRKQRTEHHEVQRPAQKGDRATTLILATINGERVGKEGGNEVPITLGAHDDEEKESLMTKFSDALVGAETGETRSVSFTIPEDHDNAEQAGKEAHYELTLKKVEESRMPEIDADFCRLFDIEDGDVAKLRETVRDGMNRELENSVKAQVQRQLFDGLTAMHVFPVPDALVHQQIHQEKHRVMQQFGQQNTDVELPDDLFREQAEKNARLGLVLGAIVEAESITASDEQVREKIREMTQQYEDPEHVANLFYGDEQMLQRIESQVIEEQVIEHVLTQAVTEPVPCSFEEARSGSITAPPIPEAEPEGPSEAEASDAADASDEAEASDATEMPSETEASDETPKT